MVHLLRASAWLLALFQHFTPSFGAPSSYPTPPGFTYNDHDFLLHGKPYQIIGGQMDPQRIPREYWTDRLKMARAMGLNTILAYIFWNKLEPEQGQWDFTGNNDIAEYFRLAQQEGLNIVLRPGPYICGEREWGGFPYWLTQIDGMKVRSNNEPFLDATDKYLARLAEEVGTLQADQGGPILMVQLENEYGYFGNDKEYLSRLASSLKNHFDMPLYTNDGATLEALQAGGLSGVLAESDGDPRQGFEARNNLTDPSQLGPLLDGEYYIAFYDKFESGFAHRTIEGDAAAIQKVADDLDFVLSGNNSISIYMFHGGSNFAFDNGASWENGNNTIVTSSYDYGAPLDESGRPIDVYMTIRDTIAKYVPEGSIPDIPKKPDRAEFKAVELVPVAQMFNSPQGAVATGRDEWPQNMEALGQAYGFVLYQHNVSSAVTGNIQPGDYPRDRVMVFVNGQRVGLIDSRYAEPANVTVDLKGGDVLQLLVENLGRDNFGGEIVEQRKGIVGNVTVADIALSDWSMYSFQYNLLSKNLPAATQSHDEPKEVQVGDHGVPVFYTGVFSVPAVGDDGPSAADTYLTVRNGNRGNAWVNGYHLGRYWVVGPQQQLYVPGVWLKGDGQPNSLVVLELDPEQRRPISVEGVKTRSWYNQADPDAP